MGAWGTHVVGLRSNSRLFLNEYAFTLPCCPTCPPTPPPATMPIDGAVGTADAAATNGGFVQGKKGREGGRCAFVLWRGAVLVALFTE